MLFAPKSIVLMRGSNNKNIFNVCFYIIIFLLLSACENYPVNSQAVYGAAGKAGLNTPVEIDTEGNMLGYYEYLPLKYNEKSNEKYPVIFFWNGKNTISGNGKNDLTRLLKQGLSEYINEGNHYPAIIITAQIKKGDWKKIDIHPFVEYILKRYSRKINLSKVYMTGFSAGGGITMRYALKHAEILAAIVPLSPAIRYPDENDSTEALSSLSTWFFHNSGDITVKKERSIQWHELLKEKGGDHLITIYQDESHYSWQRAYKEEKLWNWLLSRSL